MAGVGAVIGTVASGGAAAIGVLGGVAGGALGYKGGKAQQQQQKKALDKVQFEGNEKPQEEEKIPYEQDELKYL